MSSEAVRSEISPDAAALTFDVAHPNAPSKSGSCSACSKPIQVEYFEVDGNVMCTSCRGALDVANPSAGRGGRLLRAVGFGAAMAAATAAGYAAFKMTTGWDVGLIAILVGYLVGKAVHVGSRQRGGRGYQVLAVLLTYLAISASHVPSVVGEWKERTRSDRAAAAPPVATDDPWPTARPAAAPEQTPVPEEPSRLAAAESAVNRAGGMPASFLFATGVLLLGLLALPVMIGMASIMSVVMLAIALWQAWQTNHAVVRRVTGPYQVAHHALAPLASQA